jgi:hypothetical protein
MAGRDWSDFLFVLVSLAMVVAAVFGRDKITVLFRQRTEKAFGFLPVRFPPAPNKSRRLRPLQLLPSCLLLLLIIWIIFHLTRV